MTQRPIVPLVLAVALFGAIIYIMRLNAEVSNLRQGTGARPAETARQPVSSAPRTFTDEQRQSMLSALRTEEGPVRKVWFVVDQSKPEPVARPEAILLATGSERDLARDHPETLVVVVRVRLIVGTRLVVPHERLEALGLESLEERALGRRPRLVPRDPFERHQPGFGPTITT